MGTVDRRLRGTRSQARFGEGGGVSGYGDDGDGEGGRKVAPWAS
jgi:hypothetical protein